MIQEFVVPSERDGKAFLHKQHIPKATMEQIKHLTNNTSLSHVRFMPDCHYSAGCCVGMTSKLGLEIQPWVIGSDIGCGILTYPLPDVDLVHFDFAKIDCDIRARVPIGSSVHKRAIITKADWLVVFQEAQQTLSQFVSAYRTAQPLAVKPRTTPRYDMKHLLAVCRKIGADFSDLEVSMGTLGGGNHYLELNVPAGQSPQVCQELYLTVHCGSRTFGQAACKYHTGKMAKGKSLTGEQAWDYYFDLILCQHLAMHNRRIILREMAQTIVPNHEVQMSKVIESIHNYIDFKDQIVRKGAIAISSDNLSIVSLTMRDGLWLCRSIDDNDVQEDWNRSAPHGLGRDFGRGEASSRLNLEEYQRSMQGIYSTSVVAATLDESPAAYKNMSLVEQAVKDRLVIEQHLTPVMNIKALS